MTTQRCKYINTTPIKPMNLKAVCYNSVGSFADQPCAPVGGDRVVVSSDSDFRASAWPSVSQLSLLRLSDNEHVRAIEPPRPEHITPRNRNLSLVLQYMYTSSILTMNMCVQ